MSGRTPPSAPPSRLKLSNFEETGGIVAALTTSLPEAPNSGRTWDYRYCWLRDAYFVVRALNRIGATKTMEDFIAFVFSIVGEEDVLKPVYGIVPSRDLTEWIAPDLKGFEGHGPSASAMPRWSRSSMTPMAA